MSVFSVDPSALQSASSKLEAASSEYESIYKQLIQAATSLGSAYVSEDNKIFVSKIEACGFELQKMANELQNTAQRLAKIAQNYEGTEGWNVTQAQGL